MGLTDHQKTWTVRTAASPSQCVSAFSEALGSPGLVFGTRWKVRGSTSAGGEARATATYEGRSGLIGLISMFIPRTQQEIQAALGSEMTFIATPAAGGTQCSMAMTKVGTVLLFTADARFFKIAMRRVIRQLRSNDEHMVLEKV
jgi:hypothetical protein